MSEILQGKKFKCAFCDGSGIQPRSLKSSCLACRGKGEVEFEGPVIQCPACHGRGRASPSSMLSCVHCRGVGVVEKSAAPSWGEPRPKGREGGGDIAEVIGERLGEITKRLQWTRKETEKKTKEIEKRLKPIRPFVKAALKGRASPNAIGREIEKESIWLNKLGNKIKRGWQSLWED